MAFGTRTAYMFEALYSDFLSTQILFEWNDHDTLPFFFLRELLAPINNIAKWREVNSSKL